MHNCKATRKSLIELLFDESPAQQSARALAELETCADCREEYASLKNVLRASDNALQGALPDESFWRGYHSRLRRRLMTESELKHTHASERQLTVLRNLLFRTSLPVPAPVAALLIICFGFSIVFAIHSRHQLNVERSSHSTSVEMRNVAVPVIQERVVTQVVYRERKRHRGDRAESWRPKSRPTNGVAGLGPEISQKTSASLSGFKPANEVKLTIIKGSYHNEK
jgi:hypothetical protein